MTNPNSITLWQQLAIIIVTALTVASTHGAERQAYRLGPGDSVNLYILGQPETKVDALPIAPDGTISYRQVRVRIGGLTVSEARKQIEAALQKFERNVRVVLTPGGIGSKSYTILGQVPNQGRFNLDRSITLLEALAQAGGLSKEDGQVGAVNQRVNLDQSFIVRKGRKLAVDFTSLYAEGNTKENIRLQHEDHIYIASNLNEEYYVFGAVNNQGMQRVRPGLGVVGAIVEQAGFAPGAWKGKVLLVRGSMKSPDTTVIDVAEGTQGQGHRCRHQARRHSLRASEALVSCRDHPRQRLHRLSPGCRNNQNRYRNSLAAIVRSSFILPRSSSLMNLLTKLTLSSLTITLFVACDPMPSANGSNRFDPRAKAATVGDGGVDASPNFHSYKVPGRIPNSMLRPKSVDYRLGVGDNLTIELADKPETLQPTQVMPDGMVYFDLAEGVPAEGRTVEELTAAITKKMEAFERRPLVRITLNDITSRNYFILGQVQKPGVYPLVRSLTVLDAISEAGGLASTLNLDLESLPDLSKSYVVRKDKMIPVNFQALVENGDMSQNIYLEPNDYIYVPSTQDAKIYVLGAVANPKSFTHKNGSTLVSTMARAGGPTEKAYREKIVVLRGSLTEPEYAIVNFKNVIQGRGTDFALNAGDIVWVPNSPWEKVEEFLVQVVSAAAQAVAVYQGGGLIDKDAAQPATIGIQ